ncbi:MAG: NAD dependent epimerase/dehydratase family protein, partial [Candidatus Lokiarchaeum sp. GC14_75]
MRVLFIGGTGLISSACSRLAIEKRIDLYHFNRGKSHRHIDGVKTIIGNIRNINESKNELKDYSFDVVVDWICFNIEHAKNSYYLFKNKTNQFIFISSASIYQKPIPTLPITEETPIKNPFWQYSRDKIACEKFFQEMYKENQFPITIIRPSHTYDKTSIPLSWGYTAIDRMKERKKIIIHGDGTSIWVMTYHQDFAKGFLGILGNKKSIGERFHITSDELLTWNKIYQTFADELGVPLTAVHVTSEKIAKIDSKVGASLLGDKSYSVIFDNSK